jgi:SAM-dependent methyltransferase
MATKSGPRPDHNKPNGYVPSPWVRRFAATSPKIGQVLDLACGGGRHVRLLLEFGHQVVAVDKDTSRIADLKASCEVIEADLEAPGSDPLAGRRFSGIIVTNYLHRPILAKLPDALENAGVLIYETFADGNERFGKPRNPDHLLKAGELLDAVQGKLRVIAYEDLIVTEPRPAAVQRIAAIKDGVFS